MNSLLAIATVSLLGCPAQEAERITAYEKIARIQKPAHRLRIADDPFWIEFTEEAYEHPLGLRMMKAPTDEWVLVPNFLLLARIAALSADRYWTALGGTGNLKGLGEIRAHDFRISPALWLRGEREAHGVFRRPDVPWGLGGSSGWRPSIELNLAAVRSADAVLYSTVHEWFHLVQYRNWMTWSFLQAVRGQATQSFGAAMEGTAEWATDLPIEFDTRRVGADLLPEGKKTADSLNRYFESRYPRFNSSIGHQGFMTGRDPLRLYDTVFYWKSLAARAGTGERDLNVITRFFERYAKQSWQGLKSWMESAGAVLPEQYGNGLAGFRKFYEDYLADVLAYSRNEARAAGWTDEPFLEGQLRAVRPDLDWGDPCSREVEEIPETEAEGEAEIGRRLSGVAEAFSLPPLGFQAISIRPRNRWTTVGVVPGTRSAQYKELGEPWSSHATGIFVLAWGDPDGDGWTAAMLSHRGRFAGIREKDTRMDRLDFSIQDSSYRLPSGGRAAFTYRDDFNTPGDIERIWLALGNVDPDRAQATAHVAYVIVPFFEEFPVPDKPQPRGSSYRRLVRFKDSFPPRDPAVDSFKPGDRIAVELDLSGKVHVGSGAIRERNTTLRAQITGPDGAALQVESPEFTCGDSRHCRYVYSFVLPKEYRGFGTHRLQFTASSLLRLGRQDRAETDAWEFDVSADRPVVKRVEVAGKETWFDDTLGYFRPIPPDTAEFRITFDRDMDRNVPADVQFGGKKIDGAWMSDRVWRGKGIEERKGVQVLSIQAADPLGNRIDADSTKEGEQPDESRRLIVDTPPPYVMKLQVRVAGLRYGATWKSSSDESMAHDLREGKFRGSRELTLQENRPLPDEKLLADLYVDFSQPLEVAPRVTVGGLTVPLKQSGTPTTWCGQFSAADLRRATAPYPIVIEAQDIYGNALDAHPGTVPRLRLPASPGESWWVGYENSFASDEYEESGKGGRDVWHWLDASGLGEEWVEKDDLTGDTWTFHLIRRDDEVLVRYETEEYRGRASGVEIEVQKRVRRKNEIGTVWYDSNLRRIAPPSREVLDELDSEYVKKGRVTSKSRMSLVEPGRYQGKTGQLSLRWDATTNRITSFESPSVRLPRTWTRTGPKIEETKSVGPKSSKPAATKPEIRESWETYRMTHRMSGKFHLIDILHVRFEENTQGKGRLVVTEYPVSTIENHETRAILWQVEWRSGEVVEKKEAADAASLDSLRRRAAELRKDGFERSAIPERVEAILGSKSRLR